MHVPIAAQAAAARKRPEPDRENSGARSAPSTQRDGALRYTGGSAPPSRCIDELFGCLFSQELVDLVA